MSTNLNFSNIISSSLKNSLNLPHMHCKPLVSAHLRYSGDYNITDNSFLNDKDFLVYLDALSTKLKCSIETTGSNPSAIIANNNYKALLPSELLILYDTFKELPATPSVNEFYYPLLKIGTLDQILSLFNIPSGIQRYNHTNFRQLFSAYINIHKQSDGKYLVVIRELDTLAYCPNISQKIHARHMKAVTSSFIREGQKSTKISAIAFEMINNISVLTDVSTFFDKNVGSKRDSYFQELMSIKAKRDVLAFDCS